MKRAFFISAFLAFGISVFANCPPQGDSKDRNLRALDILKNRPTAPKASQIDPAISLSAMLEKGDDTNRFQPSQGATITGYVVVVKRGGLESCNCHSRTNRDRHIELSDEPNAPAKHRVIVEITPRLNVSTPQPLNSLVGKRVTVTGWMFQ